MKKIFLIIAVMFLFVGCTTKRVEPKLSELPSGLELVQSAGNGWYLYSSPIGYFLATVQIQGEFKIGFSNRFVDLVYIGKELKND